MALPTFSQDDLREFNAKLTALQRYKEHPRAQHPQVKEKIEFMIHAFEQAILFHDSDDIHIKNSLIQLVETAVEMEADVIEHVMVQGGHRVIIEEQRLQWL